MSDYTPTVDEIAVAYAAQTFNETPETRIACVDEIRAWLDSQPLNARRDTKTILAFLRGCKFDVTKTKQKLTAFYRMRAERPEWFADRDPTRDELTRLLDLGLFLPLLKRDRLNRLVVIVRTGVHSPSQFKMNDIFKIELMILDVAVALYEYCQIYGVATIFDMNGVTLHHALQLPPQLIRRAVHAWQNYHCKPKRLNFINAPAYVNVLLNAFKQFMSAKLKERTHVYYAKYEEIYEEIPRDILPVEYGGASGTVAELTAFWKQRCLERREWFREDEKFKPA